MRVDLALVAAAALVMTAMDRVDHRTTWTEPKAPTGPVLATGVFAVLVGLSAALVIRQPLYGFYSWTGYFWAWRLFTGRGRLVGVALVAAVTAISQTGAGPYDTVYGVAGLVAVYLINAGVAGALTWFGWIGNQQQQRRVQEVSALTEANARLEASLRHNADLQEQLLTQAREAGISEERRRLAREIHDTLAQGLMGIITQLQAAQGAENSPAHPAHPGEAAGARHVEVAIELARESLAEARRSVQALAPEPLAGARLPDAIQDVSERWCELHGPPRPRHDQGGFGLSGMRQRVEGVAGTLEIESEPGGGTAISAAVPAAPLGDRR
jgi:signal transduction histidine kinase